MNLDKSAAKNDETQQVMSKKSTGKATSFFFLKIVVNASRLKKG